MTDGLRSVEEGVRELGEALLPYRAYFLLSAGLIGTLLLRLRYPHKVKYFPTANSIPDVVFSRTAHNFKGKIAGITAQNGLQVLLVHRPNWNPFHSKKSEAICVQIAGVAQVKDTAEATLRQKLIGKKVSIDLTGRNKEENAVEGWVYIRRTLRKRSLSHLLVSLDWASVRPVPSPGFTLTSETSYFPEKTLQKMTIKPQTKWYTRLFRSFFPPKF